MHNGDTIIWEQRGTNPIVRPGGQPTPDSDVDETQPFREPGPSRLNQGSPSRQHDKVSTVTFSDPSHGGLGGWTVPTNVRPYLADIDSLAESYRVGTNTKLEAVSAVTQILNEDAELSPQERTQSFELFLAEIEVTKKGVQQGTKRRSGGEPEPSQARNQLARALAVKNFRPANADSSEGEISADSDSGDERPHKQHKLQPSDMPWHRQRGEQPIMQNPSCVKSASIIRRLHKDLKSAKLYVKLTPDAP